MGLSQDISNTQTGIATKTVNQPDLSSVKSTPKQVVPNNNQSQQDNTQIQTNAEQPNIKEASWQGLYN